MGNGNMEPDWQHVREEALAIMAGHENDLEQETIDGVRHYIDHGEYEMAIEGLVLDLLAQGKANVDWERCIFLARLVGLDKESVFDPEFWQKLSARASATD